MKITTLKMQDLQPRFDRVLVVCHYDTVTGGPEAMHQLSGTLRALGCVSLMVYFGDRLQVTETHACSLSPTEKVNNSYSQYNTKSEEVVILGENDLIIFPEILANEATRNFKCQVAIWWLSVDNAINWNSRLKYKNVNQPIFVKQEIIHFYQSQYAHQYLIENDARVTVPLYDYTSLNFTHKTEDRGAKIFDVALFPTKGAHLAESFVKTASNLRYIQIANMTKAQVAQSLSSTHIYIDFGHQPGKDRVPREAAVCGCLVFLHRQGSAAYYEDSPLDDFFLFTSDDIISGNLGERVKLALESIAYMKSFQNYYVNRIKNEKREFELQCLNFFTTISEY
jgi:hypothetical protein